MLRITQNNPVVLPFLMVHVLVKLLSYGLAWVHSIEANCLNDALPFVLILRHCLLYFLWNRLLARFFLAIEQLNSIRNWIERTITIKRIQPFNARIILQINGAILFVGFPRKNRIYIVFVIPSYTRIGTHRQWYFLTTNHYRAKVFSLGKEFTHRM